MIGFTLCSNNYLAHAAILAESWRKQHPNSPFIVGLVDRRRRDVKYPRSATILPVEDVHVDHFSNLAARYNIIELNVAVKPFYFDHLFQCFGDPVLVYLDPDIVLFDRLSDALDKIQTAECIVTPHICSPVWRIDTGPNDYDLLKTGIFNLGFLMLRYTPSVQRFVAWWRSRMLLYAYRSTQTSLFYDQIWFNYCVAFLDAVYIQKHPGYNVANWNLHERTLTLVKNRWIVNGTHRLAFFHFSHFDPGRPGKIAGYNNRHDFSTNPELRCLFNEYHEKLINNRYSALSKVKCAFESCFTGTNYYRERDGVVTVHGHSELAARLIKTDLDRYLSLTKAGDWIPAKL